MTVSVPNNSKYAYKVSPVSNLTASSNTSGFQIPSGDMDTYL